MPLDINFNWATDLSTLCSQYDGACQDCSDDGVIDCIGECTDCVVDMNTLLRCQDSPDDCTDCDGDGEMDCLGECGECELLVDRNCEDYPFMCVDCDGDDEVECSGGCQTAQYWRITDPCVPPVTESLSEAGAAL